MSTATEYKYETLAVSNPSKGVLEVALNRPKQLNAMNGTFWREMALCFGQADKDPEVRSIVITGGECRVFSAGLDLMDAMGGVSNSDDFARRAIDMEQHILDPQLGISAIEACRKPVVAALHGGVIGGGVDLACACDIRYCSKDAYFCIAEVNVGLAADVGTLQRLPKIVGNDSIVRELALTGRKMDADEAVHLGLVGKILADRVSCVESARAVAAVIAEKSPVAVVGTKISLNYSRNHTIQEGLDHIRTWNMSMLQSTDLMTAVQAQMAKKKAIFSNL